MDVPWALIGPASGWAAFLTLAWFTARSVQSGDWIPRTTHERELAQVNDALERERHDSNEWRAEGRIKDAQIAEKDKQLSHMGEVGRTVDAIMTSLQEAYRGIAKGNGNGNRSRTNSGGT